MINNEVVSRIAQKIKAVRLKKNMTIHQLAERTRVTKGLLSKIENSRTIPSLPVFVQIIQSLDISLKEFFDDMSLTNGKDYVVIRRSDYQNVQREGRKGFSYEFIFSQNISTSVMETVLLTIEPGATGRETIGDGFEFKHLLKGNCEYQIGNEVVGLTEGDSIYFDASVPHIPINRSQETVVMIVFYFLSTKEN